MHKNKFFLFFTSCLIFFGNERLYHKATDGFCVHRIQQPSFLHKNFDDETHHQELNQTFTYLGSGAQCYAFVSEDGRYVLKFLKCHHLRLHPIFEALPLSGWLSKYRTAKKFKKAQELSRQLDSYHIAFETIKELTHLTYLHLHSTSHLQRVKIKDKLGNLFLLDLNSTPFLIQKKGELFWDSLLNYIDKNELEEAKKLIDSLVNLLAKRIALKVYDKDPDLKTNFGVINHKVFQLDIGRLSLERREITSEFTENELRRILTPLSSLFSKLYPSLNDELNLCIQRYTIKQT